MPRQYSLFGTQKRTESHKKRQNFLLKTSFIGCIFASILWHEKAIFGALEDDMEVGGGGEIIVVDTKSILTPLYSPWEMVNVWAIKNIEHGNLELFTAGISPIRSEIWPDVKK